MALPAIDTLTPSAARTWLHDIRTVARPQLLDSLRRLYASDDGDAMATAAILADEVRLRVLDAYLLDLLALARQEGEPFGWERFRPALRGVEQQSLASVQADVELAFSPENHECVHGPCTLVPVTQLAQRLLRAGERLTAIERVTWSLPLRHQVHLTVWDTAVVERQASGVFLGELRTSEGRALAFEGQGLLDRPLARQTDYNRLSQQLVTRQQFTFGPEPETITMPLSEDGLAACREALRRRPVLTPALLLDLVPIAILNWRRGRSMLACGYRDVPLASSGEAFASGSRLEVRFRPDRTHSSARSGLTISYYEFRYTPRHTAWSTMVMAEAPTLEMLLRQLHS